MGDLLNSTYGFTNKKEDEIMAAFVADFVDNLKAVGKTHNGKTKLVLKKMRSVEKHMERADLFRKKAIMVRFVTYSPFGLTLESMNKTVRRAGEEKPVEG